MLVCTTFESTSYKNIISYVFGVGHFFNSCMTFYNRKERKMFSSNMNYLIERIMDFDGEFEYYMKIILKLIMKCKRMGSY